MGTGHKKGWYYKNKSGRHEYVRGPFTKDELLERLRDGVIEDDLYVRHEKGHWMPLHQYLSKKNEKYLPWQLLFIIVAIILVLAGIAIANMIFR
jgi:hypothetical protein